MKEEEEEHKRMPRYRWNLLMNFVGNLLLPRVVVVRTTKRRAVLQQDIIKGHGRCLGKGYGFEMGPENRSGAIGFRGSLDGGFETGSQRKVRPGGSFTVRYVALIGSIDKNLLG